MDAFYNRFTGTADYIASRELQQAVNVALALGRPRVSQLARTVVVKSESHYDSYDRAFLEFFGGIVSPPEVVDEALKWVENSLPPLKIPVEERAQFREWDLDELMRSLEERLHEQNEEHHGGSHWIGTGGTSRFGHSGYNLAGVRIDG